MARQIEQGQTSDTQDKGLRNQRSKPPLKPKVSHPSSYQMGVCPVTTPPEQGTIALAPQAQFVLAPSDCAAAVCYVFWVLTKAESATGFRGHIFLEVVDQKLGQQSGQAETGFIRGHTGGCLEPP